MKNQLVCINNKYIEEKDEQGCEPIFLKQNQSINIENVYNSWKIITDRGDIIGNVEYKNTFSKVLQYTSLIFLIIGILLLIIYFIIRKK